MATIEFNKDDFLELVGEDLSDEEIEERLTNVKVEVEEIIDDRVAVEVTSDRIDLLSVEGIARALRAHLGTDSGLKDYDIEPSDYAIDVEEVPAREHIVTAVVEDVDLSTAAFKSLIQLQEKLHGTFGRHRERVSIGMHDIRQLSFPLRYHDADPDELGFIPLERDTEMTLRQIAEQHDKGQEYADIVADHDRWPVITDDSGRVLSFPPVINGKVTEVSTATDDIFIDVTGTDPESIEYALNVLVTALAERGGTIREVQMHTPEHERTMPRLEESEHSVDIDYMQQVTGLDLDQEAIREHLEAMGYGVIELGDRVQVMVPSFRADILHQVDIAEDIAIGYGYNNMEPAQPDLYTTGEDDPAEKYMHSVRELMAGLGYQEIMNPTLTDTDTLLDDVDRKSHSLVRLANPVSEQYSVARDALFPQLLATLGRNTHNRYPQKIFEAADVLLKDESRPVMTRTDKHVAAARCAKDADYTGIREDLAGLLEALGIDATFHAAASGPFIDGRCARIEVDGEPVGHVGEVHPRALERFDIEMPVAGFELHLEPLDDRDR